MVNFEIKWSGSYKIVDDKDGMDKWRRHWIIPMEYRSAFFNFWSKNKFKLWSEGFSVTKQEDTWILLETKFSPENFKSFKGNPTPKVSETEEVFWLPPYKVKDTSGLRSWQIESVSSLIPIINKLGAAVDGSDLGCHARGQFILMADGKTKKVEDVVVDDFIMGWKGPQKVITLHRGKEQMVKIKPTKGESFVVNINHILTLFVRNPTKTHKKTGPFQRGTVINIRVKDYLNLSKTTKNLLNLMSSDCIECWKTIEQPFSPYFIGALLGDGGLSSSAVVTFTSADSETWYEIKKECEKYKWILGKTNQEITKRITNAPNLFAWLKEVKLKPISCENRFIPNIYKICNIDQRLEILAGLIDTDGYYGNTNMYSYCSKSKKLAEDMMFIARSLGFFCTFKQINKKCCNNGKWGVYYRVNICGNINRIPCRIIRKKAHSRRWKKDVLRRSFKVELLDEDEFFGFSLDGDGRFLLDDFTITHNTGKTYSAIGVVRELDCPFVVVCPKSIKHQWENVICNHFKLKDKLLGIINYELLIRGKSDSKIASYITNRKTHREKFTWKIPRNTIILWDESQKLKNFKTKNSKCCMEAFKQGYKMLFCSATIGTNPLELRTIGTVLGLFKGGPAYYQWCFEHGCSRGRFGIGFTEDIEIRSKVLKKLHKDIFINRGVRLTRDTIPNFPECEIIADCYNMDDEDVKKINEYHKEMCEELKRLSMLVKRDTASELTAIIRERQKTELVKTPLMVEMVEEGIEQGMSVVVFVNFTETLNALSKRLNTKCIFDGKTSDKERQQNVDNFQSDKERVILVNVQSGGSGLTLGDITGKFPRLSLISPSYSAVVMRQVTGRIWRESSKTKSIQRIIFISDTVEERVCEIVKDKLDNLDLLNDGALSYVNK